MVEHERRRYTFAEVRYLLRGILADLILGMALRAAPYPDKAELARVLQGYWVYAIKRAEQNRRNRVSGGPIDQAHPKS